MKVKKVKDKGDPAKIAAAKAAALAKKNAVVQPDGHVEGQDGETVTIGADKKLKDLQLKE